MDLANKYSEYNVYIDESGDEGIKRGSTWFILTAIIVPKKYDSILSKKILDIKTSLLNYLYKKIRAIPPTTLSHTSSVLPIDKLSTRSLLGERITLTIYSIHFFCKICKFFCKKVKI